MVVKEQWVSCVRQIVEEVVCLCGLVLMFECWYEQMILFMEQNYDMYVKNQELQFIVWYVVIVLFNVFIEVVCVGMVGWGFVVVVSEVCVLVVCLEELLKSYCNSFYLNDLIIIVMFQDIQVGGKMIIVLLLSVEVLVSQF